MALSSIQRIGIAAVCVTTFGNAMRGEAQTPGKAAKPARTLPKPDAAITQYLKSIGAEKDAGLVDIPSARLGTTDAPLTGLLFWYPRGPNRQALVLQRDVALRSPMAQVGDTVYLLERDEEQSTYVSRRPATVKGRQAFRHDAKAACKDGVHWDGWIYSVAGLTPTRNEMQGDGGYSDAQRQVIPAKLGKAGYQGAYLGDDLGPIRSAFGRILDSIYHTQIAELRAGRTDVAAGSQLRGRRDAAQIRKDVLLDYTSGELLKDRQPFMKLVGPAKSPLYLTALRLNDNPRNFDFGTEMLLIFDQTGKVVVKKLGGYDHLWIGDLDGDSIDEIIFSDGIGKWNGGSWIIPVPEPQRPEC